MPDAQTQNTPEDKPVAVTLMLDPWAYQAFLQKAKKANLDIGPYLSSTLSIVLGCRAFNGTSSCTPQPMAVLHPLDNPKQVPGQQQP